MILILVSESMSMKTKIIMMGMMKMKNQYRITLSQMMNGSTFKCLESDSSDSSDFEWNQFLSTILYIFLI